MGKVNKIVKDYLVDIYKYADILTIIDDKTKNKKTYNIKDFSIKIPTEICKLKVIKWELNENEMELYVNYKKVSE